MPFGLLIEGLVAVLLALTVIYCIQLDRRLKALRSGQDGLKELIAALDRSTARAQESMQALSGVGSDATGELRSQIAEARVLADELAIMVESGNNLANRLEGGRDRATNPASGSGVRRAESPVSIEDNPLLRALKEAR